MLVLALAVGLVSCLSWSSDRCIFLHFVFLPARGSHDRSQWMSDEECFGQDHHILASGIVVGRRRTFPNSPGVRPILAHTIPILQGAELHRGVFIGVAITARCSLQNLGCFELG